MTALAGPAHAGASLGDDSLVLLVETIERLSEARSVQDVAAIVCSAARRICGADGVCFVLRDSDECWYLDEDAMGPLWKGRRFPASACISGWVMLNRQTAVISDVFADDRVPHDAYAPTFVKSLVMTPVRASDPIGAIGAYWSQIRRPEPAEVARLALVARATATALENVRLIRELDHRVKNNLAAVRSIVQQTLRAAPTPQAFSEALVGRLDALSRAYDLIAREQNGEARLHEVLEQALPEAHEGRISIEGPELRLSPQTAVNFQMAFHELATNAARHGALTSADGRVEVSWQINQSPDSASLVLSWRELGAGAVQPPRKRGFGLRLVESALAQGLGGKAVLAFDPDGLRYELSAPLSTALWAAEG